MNKSKYYEAENKEWLASLDYVLQNEDPERVQEITSPAAY